MVVFVDEAEVEPLHLCNGGGTVRARREEGAGLAAHRHEQGVGCQVLLPSLLLSVRITRMPGSLPEAPAGRARYPLMLPFPCGEGTVAVSVFRRLSSLGTCCASA